MAKVTLQGNADAVEFCPSQPYLHVLAAASYTLQEGDQPTRLGEVYLFSVEKTFSNERVSNLVLNQQYRRDVSGVFDIKWRPSSDGATRPCLAQASADGSVSFQLLVEGDTGSSARDFHLEERSSLNVSSAMCLYVDWSPGSESQVTVSHSDGSLSLLDVGQAEPEIISSWDAHGYECWTVTYDKFRPHVVLSGGDDCHFCCWDLRDFQTPVFRNSKAHQMGVCSIQSSPLLENTLVTGSYDENIRVWDLRMINKPVLQVEVGTGGGVWRLKWHHADRELLLAACMHNGFAVARVGVGEVEVLERYEEHNSLAYGGSWFAGEWTEPSQCVTVPEAQANLVESPSSWGLTQTQELEVGCYPETTPNCLVATCSFYDRALHVWEPKTPASLK